MTAQRPRSSGEKAAYRFQRLAFDAGIVILTLGVLQVLPLALAYWTKDQVAADAFLASCLLAFLLGGAASLGSRGGRARHRTDELIVFPFVLFFSGGVFGALPFFFLSPTITVGTAFYEAVSLITTNGASALSLGEPLTPPLEIWRGLLAWLGGLIALIVIICVLLPLNAGGYRLHLSALVLDHGDNLEDRIISALKTVIPMYGAISVICFISLLVFGNSPLNAFLKMCGSVSLTGITGVNWESGSGPEVLTILLFLILVALNWDVLAQLAKNKFLALLTNFETKALLFAALAGIILLSIVLQGDLVTRLGYALVISISAITTTGWYFNIPPDVIDDKVILLALGLAILGGASLSATGGIKQLRGVALREIVGSELSRLAHPNSIQRRKIGKATIEASDSDSLWFFITLMIGVLVFGTLGLAALGVDFKSAIYITLSHMTLSAPLVDGLGDSIERVNALYEDELILLSFVLLIARVEACILLVFLGRKFWRL